MLTLLQYPVQFRHPGSQCCILDMLNNVHTNVSSRRMFTNCACVVYNIKQLQGVSFPDYIRVSMLRMFHSFYDLMQVFSRWSCSASLSCWLHHQVWFSLCCTCSCPKRSCLSCEYHGSMKYHRSVIQRIQNVHQNASESHIDYGCIHVACDVCMAVELVSESLFAASTKPNNLK
jgi:hypothetical protein